MAATPALQHLLLLMVPLLLAHAHPVRRALPQRRFSSNEHIALGDSFGRPPGLSSDKITLPNGLQFTFGELVSLYGERNSRRRRKKGEEEKK